jgi:hypothetical protein
MIMTIDLGSYSSDDLTSSDESIFHRLYAPVAPHTTSKTGRSCTSCHNNPVALGYGRGELVYTTDGGVGKWTFKPAYSNNPYDGLPEDAWIVFPDDFNDPTVGTDPAVYSTRTSFRPFNLIEQKKILTVGACLTCHEESSTVMLNSLKENFNITLDKLNSECILPHW